MSRVSMGGLLAAVSIVMSTASVRADALLDQVMAGARADSQIAWRVDRLNTDMTATGETRETSLSRFDGTAAKGARWSLLSVNGKSAAAKDCADFSDKFNKTNYAPTYAQLTELLGSGAIKTGTDLSGTHYRLNALPAKAVTVSGYDLSKGLQAEFTVDTSGTTPFINTVRITAPKPFKPASIGRVDRLDRHMVFARGPQGMPVLVSSSVAADFKVLFKNISMRTHTVFQNQQPVVQTAQLGKSSGAR
jgi:hypothetical protein